MLRPYRKLSHRLSGHIHANNHRHPQLPPVTGACLPPASHAPATDSPQLTQPNIKVRMPMSDVQPTVQPTSEHADARNLLPGTQTTIQTTESRIYSEKIKQPSTAATAVLSSFSFLKRRGRKRPANSENVNKLQRSPTARSSVTKSTYAKKAAITAATALSAQSRVPDAAAGPRRPRVLSVLRSRPQIPTVQILSPKKSTFDSKAISGYTTVNNISTASPVHPVAPVHHETPTAIAESVNANNIDPLSRSATVTKIRRQESSQHRGYISRSSRATTSSRRRATTDKPYSRITPATSPYKQCYSQTATRTANSVKKVGTSNHPNIPKVSNAVPTLSESHSMDGNPSVDDTKNLAKPMALSPIPTSAVSYSPSSMVVDESYSQASGNEHDQCNSDGGNDQSEDVSEYEMEEDITTTDIGDNHLTIAEAHIGQIRSAAEEYRASQLAALQGTCSDQKNCRVEREKAGDGLAKQIPKGGDNEDEYKMEQDASTTDIDKSNPTATGVVIGRVQPTIEEYYACRPSLHQNLPLNSGKDSMQTTKDRTIDPDSGDDSGNDDDYEIEEDVATTDTGEGTLRVVTSLTQSAVEDYHKINSLSNSKPHSNQSGKLRKRALNSAARSVNLMSPKETLNPKETSNPKDSIRVSRHPSSLSSGRSNASIKTIAASEKDRRAGRDLSGKTAWKESPLIARSNDKSASVTTPSIKSLGPFRSAEDEDKDPMMVAEYADDIFKYLSEMEVKLSPTPGYITQQPELEWRMRSVLVDWLARIHQLLKLHSETLYLTINLIDRFLAAKVVSRAKLQLVGLTALLLAIKYEETTVPRVRDVLYLSNNAFTKDELIKAERLMSHQLKFDFGWPCSLNWLRRVSKADNFDVRIRTLAKYFMEASLLDHRFLEVLPSLLAAAAYRVAKVMLGQEEWTKTHIALSGYTADRLNAVCCLIIHSIHEPPRNCTAIQQKYAHKQLLRVSQFVAQWTAAWFASTH